MMVTVADMNNTFMDHFADDPMDGEPKHAAFLQRMVTLNAIDTSIPKRMALQVARRMGRHGGWGFRTPTRKVPS